MGLSDATVAALGAALYEARVNRQPVDPLTAAHPEMDVADAYRVQQDLVARLLADGDRIVGYKLGLTSAPMQQLLGVDSPDFAPVLASHVHQDGATVAADGFIAPRLEAEIALVLEADLAGPDCDPAAVAKAVGAARPALEIVDSRIRDWQITLADTIADLASSGAVVLGTDATPVDGSYQLRLVGMAFSRDGTVFATGAGAASLGDPLAAVAWLANALHPFGERLRAGQFVMTGSLHGAVPIAPGERYLAEFDRLGAVSVTIG
ncbi:MAG TPA: fumarylacetoacetate hydrolase family protein [Natronosporangium sp.]